MLALANMIHLLSHEFSGLGTGSFSFACILSSPLDGLFLRHPTPPRSTWCNRSSAVCSFTIGASPVIQAGAVIICSTMNAEQWARVESHFEALRELPPADRAAK